MTAALLRRSWLLDLLIAVCLVALAGTVGYRYISTHFSIQNILEDLLYPCFRQFGRAPLLQTLQNVPAYQALFQQKLDTIPCSAVIGLPIAENGQAWLLQKYLHATLSAVLLATGPRYAGFYYVQTGMFVLTALAAYGVFRLGMGPVIAAAATVLLIVSDRHLHETTNVAEYAKAPFMLAALFFGGLTLRRPITRRRLIALSLLCGLTVGVGIGFKPDVLVCGPIFAMALICFLPPLADRQPYRRMTATVVFLTSLIVVGAPMLVTNFFGAAGSLLPVQLFGGMDRSIDDFHAAPSLYDYGIVFDDIYVTAQINSYNQRVYRSRDIVGFFFKGMTQAGKRILVDTERVFPADRILRVLGGVLRVLTLVPYGWAATVIVLVTLYATNLRLGLCVTFLLLTYVGYVSLVFIPRHYFHMLVVPLWMIGFALSHGAAAAGRWLRTAAPGRFDAVACATAPFDRGAGLRGVALLAAACLAVWAALAGARVYQQFRVDALINGYNREANFATLDVARLDLAGGRVRLELRGGLAHGWFDPPDKGMFAANYLVVDVECTAPTDSTIVTTYERPEYWQQETRVRCSTGARRWRLFLPTYDLDPQIRVRGLDWNGADPIRVLSLRKVRDLTATPLLIKLTLPDNWRGQPLYHEFSLAALERPQPW
jgi:energy-converting hydrogenase Eha subunit A